ncbi:hypothetical protein ADIAL_2108 [Alkalibacterium sp. AK22]|nr:hypothetical protein ADIAL_2108 [Alkalibacterium sp. AK22]
MYRILIQGCMQQSEALKMESIQSRKLKKGTQGLEHVY